MAQLLVTVLKKDRAGQVINPFVVELTSREGAGVHFVGEVERGKRVGKHVRQVPSGDEQVAQVASQAMESSLTSSQSSVN